MSTDTVYTDRAAHMLLHQPSGWVNRAEHEMQALTKFSTQPARPTSATPADDVSCTWNTDVYGYAIRVTVDEVPAKHVVITVTGWARADLPYSNVPTPQALHGAARRVFGAPVGKRTWFAKVLGNTDRRACAQYVVPFV